MHALIIEDEYLITLDIECRLSELGFTSFDRAATEENAVALAKVRKPDLITADVRLREGNGTSAVRRITERDAIPVIYVTGTVEEAGDVSDAILVTKPFDTVTFRRAVESAQAVQPARPTGEPQLLDGAPFDLAKLRTPSGNREDSEPQQ
jgi:DNA-binding response OmpR family regulator